MSTVDLFLPSPADDESLWASLTQGADRVEGHELEKDKTVLIGVPFMITGVTVRPAVGQEANYISAEVVVAPQSVIARRVKTGRLSIEAAERVTPLESLVINDGSTGLCRQVAQYLEDKGMIMLPDGPAAGADGESKYDTYFAQWTILQGTVGPNGHVHFPVRLMCERGLRPSEYPNPAGAGMSTTFYLG